MTPEQQRIKIAEACGWEILNTPTLYGDFACYAKDPSGQEFPGIPDYLTDLNAMHEAEKVLLADVRHLEPYKKYLAYLTCAAGEPVYHATAAQRAEAFLRALNLWTP
jgi:hypothetical protein